MSTALDVHPEVDRYLAAVRAHLADLPDSDRDDLLAEVEPSLLETAADAESIEARLGPPADFAQELRAAAGYGRGHSLRLTRLSAFLRRVPAADALPLWWVVRAYVAVAAVPLFRDSWSFRHPAIPRIENSAVTIALLAAALVLSFRLGRRERAHLVPATIVNLALLVLAVPVLWHAATARHVEYVVLPSAPPATGLVYGGAPVTNIYPYTAKGQLLHDVLLYDGAGRPITIGSSFPDPNRRVLRSKSGRPILNAYPIRYFDPGTRTIAHPDAAPPRRR